MYKLTEIKEDLRNKWSEELVVGEFESLKEVVGATHFKLCEITFDDMDCYNFDKYEREDYVFGAEYRGFAHNAQRHIVEGHPENIDMGDGIVAILEPDYAPYIKYTFKCEVI